MKTTRHLLAALCGLLTLAFNAQTTPLPTRVLFQNVRIFDGTSAELSAPSQVLVRGGVIEKISVHPIPTDKRDDTKIIDGGDCRHQAD